MKELKQQPYKLQTIYVKCKLANTNNQIKQEMYYEPMIKKNVLLNGLIPISDVNLCYAPLALFRCNRMNSGLHLYLT